MSGQQDSINKVASTGTANHHNKRPPVVLIYPTEFIKRDSVLAEVPTVGGKQEVLLASAYFPGDSDETPPEEVARLIKFCKNTNKSFIICCDANAHHTIWGSTNINKRVSPETVVIPIISCIFGFPLLALLVICCLRRRAKLAREQARRRNCDLEHGRSSRAISFRSERGMSRGFPSLELDTVVEERSDPEPDQTVVEMMTPDGDTENGCGGR